MLIYGVAVAVEKWLHHTKRITRYYVTREQRNVLIINHEPVGLYRQKKESFFGERAKAYALIARSLPPQIHTVQSASVWLDYDREHWQITDEQNSPLKRLTAVWFYWTNMENWRREPGPSWYAIGYPTYRVASMTRNEFIARFGKEE